MRLPNLADPKNRRPKVGGLEITRLRTFSSWTLGVIVLRLLALAVLFFPLNAASQENTKRVLILTGSDPNRPGFAILTRSIQSTLRDRSPVRVELLYELQTDLLDTSQPNDEESQADDEELTNYLKRKYANERIDLVLVMVAPRFRLLAQKDPTLFRDIPKVFYDFDSEREATNRSLGPNVTGVWASVDRYRATLDLAFALNPQARKVFVISGATQQNRVVMEQAQADFRNYESRAEFSYLTGETIEEVKRQLAALDKGSIVIFSSFSTDRLGNNYTAPEVLSMLAPVSAAPIYGSTETLMGLGITGGKLLDFETTGQRIAEMGMRILAGERPERIPQETAPSVMTVDWRELQRWGISEERLPPGSVVKFRQPSFWELYKWYLFGLMAVVIIQAILIAWLLFLRVRRRQAEADNLRLAGLAAAEHKRLDEIVSNVPGIVWETVIDPVTKERKTTFISNYLQTMLGYTPEEWLAESPGFGLVIMNQEDRERATRETEAVIASRREGISEFRWQGKEGQTVWTESHLSPMSDGNGGVIGLRGVTLDITARKLTEATLRQTEEKDRAILNAIPDLMFLQTRDGVYLDCHANDPRDLYVPPDRLLGKNMRDVLPADLAEDLFLCFKRAEESGGPQILEYQLTLNETERWFEARVIRSGENILTVVREITQRVFVEEALKRNEAQLAGIIGSAMDAIITVDEDQRIVLFNAAAEEVFGCSQAEAMGQPLRRFIPEQSGESHREFLRRFEENHVTPRQIGVLGNLYALRTSGEEFPIEASISQVELPGQQFYTVILRDVTTRKLAIDELRESEERFSKAFRANPQPMSLTAMADGRYIDANPSFLAMSGYTRDELIGKTSLSLRIWVRPESRAEIVRQVRECGSVVNTEMRFRTKNGSERLLLFSAERVELAGEECLLAASSDITEMMTAQLALQESEARFRNMADTAPALIWVSGADKACTYVNQRWLDFTGNTMEHELGNGWAAGVHPHDREKSLETYVNAFDRREQFSMEYRLRQADGNYRWIIDNGAPRFSSSGEFLGYIGSCMDITDRKESEESLRMAHEEVSRLKNQLQEENIYLQEEIKLGLNFGEIIGTSEALKYVLFKIEQVAPTDSTVLISGETGTGKELVARAIHNASSRRDRPLVKVNCGALSPSLIESELFGHEKGAFTGASARKIGRFELADGATIFLDEIGELPTDLQVKLLRLIQEGEFERLGSTKTMKADARIIAATNRRLDVDVKKGLFREDLWFRLNVFPITVPPLRDRRDDIPLLVEHFASMFAHKFGKAISSVSPTTLRKLSQYTWPGNVRELANVIERAVINSQGSVLRIGEDFLTTSAEQLSSPSKTLDEMEREYIIRILSETSWRIEGRHGAARTLGMNPSTLRARMNKLDIHKQELP
jgi:PAS domain S-box-containing protein